MPKDDFGEVAAIKRHDKAEAFLKDFRKLVHKYAGSSYQKADVELLHMMQDRTSVFNPYIWPKD